MRLNRTAAVRSTGFVIALLAAGTAARAVPASGIEAVTTPGSGELTMCRNWLVYRSCNTYHKVQLPKRVATGDNLPLTFGSNNKDYIFHVTGIVQTGDSCTLLSPASDPNGRGERLEVTNCRPAEKPAASK